MPPYSHRPLRLLRPASVDLIHSERRQERNRVGQPGLAELLHQRQRRGPPGMKAKITSGFAAAMRARSAWISRPGVSGLEVLLDDVAFERVLHQMGWLPRSLPA